MPPLSKQHGFSLIELVTVLLIITVLSTIAIRSTVDIGYSARYEQTKERLASIRKAIVGDPKRSINGQPDISGFVADMGRLPDNIRELIQRYDCTAPAGASPNNCTTPASPAWVDSINISVDASSTLRYGWNGPYLNISDDPNNSVSYTDGWGRETEDYCSNSLVTDPNSCPDNTQVDWITATAGLNNYGWYFNQITSNILTIASYGRNNIYDAGVSCGNNKYNGDCLSVINENDYKVNFNKITVAFRKPLNSNALQLPPSSFCDDSTGAPKTSKSACTTTWYGGCDSLGFLTKASCTTAGHKWYQCNLNTLDDDDAGYGTCAQPSCYKSKVECEKANGIWFDSNHQIITNKATVTYTQKNICLKIFYRNGSTINFIISDATDTADNKSPVQINEDGGFQLIPFTFDSNHVNTGFQDISVPSGMDAIGVYEHDGTSCTTTLYPADRSEPIQVQLVPHANLPVIFW